MKKLIAYSSVAHMGFVTMGIFAGNEQGIQGAIFQMLSHGVISGALFLCVGVVYDRMHTREIAFYGGLVNRMPVYAAIFMLFTHGQCRPAGHARLPGRNPHHGRRLPGQRVGRRRRGAWRHLLGRLRADALSQGRVRRDREPKARRHHRSRRARVGHLHPARDRHAGHGPRAQLTCSTSRSVSAEAIVAAYPPEPRHELADADLTASLPLRAARTAAGRLRADRRRHRRLVQATRAFGALSALGVVALLAAGGARARLTARRAPVEIFQGAMVVDGVGVFAKVLIAFSAAATLALGADHFIQTKEQRFEFPVLVVLAVLGMFVMVSAQDLISLYVGVELQSLAAYVLAAWRRDDARSSEAGLKYFVLSAISSGLLLFGSSFVYGFTGSIRFDAIAAAVGEGAGGIGPRVRPRADALRARLQDVAPRRSTCGRRTSTKARRRRSPRSSPPRRRSPPSR